MKNKQRREETRASILLAAEQCFAQNGYDATGVAEICARAEVSKGAFYYHFASKQAVFLALLESWLADLEQALMTIAAQKWPIAELLLQMVRAAQTTFQSNLERMPLILEFWTQSSRDATAHQASIATYRHYQQFIAGLIQRGIDEGAFEEVDPNAGAQVVLSLASGLLFQGLLDPQSADWGEVAEESIQILFNGLRRR
ncbi:MAG: TetR/AcrR family transcriptional regulator [Anaerolineae bacterium]|nr:TetR/AcrR family transcriptional regulator [Anaerolineae bacterium]